MGDYRLAFPRAARLLTPHDFGRVFAGADRVSDRYFTVLFRVSDRSTARLGLAVGRKAASRAVDRNRIKRIARDSFRHQRASLPPVDVVLMARPAARHASRVDLHGALANLWQRLVKRCEQSSHASSGSTS
ncbi:ribonuclease P protein component [Aquisalimonas asiatica]|uniref:ribonuclease P protein component n=1 Tax=Aquisalimonas asiatica TaxID=406100 RepID=UPI000B8551D7|nr:ribonuclease P protein component [Aquisalimonas asiatica]